MTYTVKWSHEFKRNVKRAVKRGLDPSEMKKLISLLRVDTQLPPSRRDHPLHGEFEGCRECHIHGDRLLVYRKKQKHAYYDLCNDRDTFRYLQGINQQAVFLMKDASRIISEGLLFSALCSTNAADLV